MSPFPYVHISNSPTTPSLTIISVEREGIYVMAPDTDGKQDKPAGGGQPSSRFQKPPRTGYFAPDKLYLLEPVSATVPVPGPAKSALDPEHSAATGNENQSVAPGKRSLEDERLPCSYLLINIIYVLWGVVGLAITLVLHLMESKSEALLNFDQSRTMDWIPTLLMYISSGLTVFAGVGGTLAFFVNFKHFLQLYRHLLWIVFVLDVYSVVFSYSSWSHMNMMQYQRLLEAEALFLNSGDESYLNLWEPRYREYWTLLQESFKCCGFDDAEDWISICNCIPNSCCRFDVSECGSTLDQMNPVSIADPSTPFNYSAIEDMIHKSGCKEVAILEQKSLQRDWIMFPLLISLFNFIFMLHGTELVLELRDLIQTARGERVVRQFRRSIWCCQWVRKLFHRRHKKWVPQRKEIAHRAGGAGTEQANAFKFMGLSSTDTSSSSEDEDKNEERLIQRSLYHAIRSKTRMIAGGLPIVRQRFQSPSHVGVDRFVTDRISMAEFVTPTPSIQTQMKAEADRNNHEEHLIWAMPSVVSAPLQQSKSAGAGQRTNHLKDKEMAEKKKEKVKIRAANNHAAAVTRTAGDKDKHPKLVHGHQASPPVIPAAGAANFHELPPHETKTESIRTDSPGGHDQHDHKLKHQLDKKHKQNRREFDVKPTPAHHQMHRTHGHGRDRDGGRVSGEDPGDLSQYGDQDQGQVAHEDGEEGQYQHNMHEHGHPHPKHKPEWQDPSMK